MFHSCLKDLECSELYCKAIGKRKHYLSRRGCQAPCAGTSQKDQLDMQHSPCCATHSALQGGVFHPALKLLLSVASTSLANKKAKSLQMGGWREREGKGREGRELKCVNTAEHCIQTTCFNTAWRTEGWAGCSCIPWC